MRLFKLLGMVLFLLIVQACPDHDPSEPDSKIYIKNESNISVYFLFKGKDSKLYNFPPNKNFLIEPQKKYDLSGAFKRMLSDGSKIYFWIFKKSTIEKYNWQEIKANNLYDKKYSFTLKELEAINYTIVYDGK